AADRGERAVLADHPLVERGAAVPRLRRAPADACGSPAILVGAQGPRLAAPRALLRGLQASERAGGLAPRLSPGHRRAGPPLSSRRVRPAAGRPARRLPLAHRDRRVARLARRPASRPAPLHTRGRRLDVRDAGTLVPGQLTSPYFVLGRQQPSTYTHVRLGLLPPSGLVWLAIWPGTLRGRLSCRQ